MSWHLFNEHAVFIWRQPFAPLAFNPVTGHRQRQWWLPVSFSQRWLHNYCVCSDGGDTLRLRRQINCEELINSTFNSSHFTFFNHPCLYFDYYQLRYRILERRWDSFTSVSQYTLIGTHQTIYNHVTVIEKKQNMLFKYFNFHFSFKPFIKSGL